MGCLDPSEYDRASTTFESLTPDATSTPSQISKVTTLEFDNIMDILVKLN
jgi:hypothetical protein